MRSTTNLYWLVHIARKILIFSLHKSNIDETRTPKYCTNNYCSWSLSYRSFDWRKIKICKKHQTFEANE